MSRAFRRLESRGGEQGFTLVELVVAVAIQAIIVAALGMAFIGILRGTKQVNEGLSRTGDARIAANYIISDARNSSGPETSLSDTTSCPDASPPVAGTASPVVRFNWTSTGAAGTTTSNVVNYVLVSNSLLRRVCQNGTLLSDRAVASNVQSVAITCYPTANCTGSPTSLTAAVSSLADSASSTPYTYTLTGAFRKLNGTGPPVSAGPSQSFILLGSSGSCGTGATGITASGSGTMKVYGNAYINTADGSTCKAMSLSNSGVFTAGKTWMLQGGTCTWSGGSSCPPITPYSPALTDPYAALTAPSTSGMPTQTGCSGAQASQTASPGFYSGGFTLGGGNTCTLASGVYVIQGGFSLSNGAILKTAPGGVLIYLMSGQFAVGGGAAITLTAQTSGTYSGIAFWQAAADTQTVSFSNGGALVFNGSFYAPKAQLNATGNAQTPVMTSLIVQTVVLTNSGGLTVGSPLSITAPTSLPSGQVNVAYTSTPSSGAGGGGAYTWSATGLPAGMTINAISGTISGTPTASLSAGTVTITLNDAAGDTAASQAFTLTIKAAPTISTASPISSGDVTFAYSKTLAVTGGTSPYTWSAPTLPAGLTMSTGGVISGTPTATGTFTVAATVTDAFGASDTKNLSITINPAPSISTTSPLPAGEKTVAYSTTLAGTGGATPYTWSAPSVPAGLTLSSTGVLAGTPTTAGTSTIVATLTDATGAQVAKNLSITINPQPSISSVVLANAASGGTAGNIGKGDTITVTYSTAMKASSFCSTWADGADRALAGDNQVTVSVSNASPDTLSVTSTGCTFNFGTIALGSNSYVSSAATFKGTGANISKIEWFESQNKLVITLGIKTAGTTATVASSAPTYNASAAIKDARGAILSPTTFTISPAAKQF